MTTTGLLPEAFDSSYVRRWWNGCSFTTMVHNFYGNGRIAQFYVNGSIFMAMGGIAPLV